MKKWLAPLLMLSIIPKCPACIAGYLALTTGIGVSFTTAASIRYAMLTICVLSLLYWGVKAGWTLRLHR